MWLLCAMSSSQRNPHDGQEPSHTPIDGAFGVVRANTAVGVTPETQRARSAGKLQRTGMLNAMNALAFT
jgi:hypothetical protein